ncbi:MAG: hypothetical protein H0T42_24640 [Deltaproteobacteria bacterium]|nr:hypothetical protein [Deltaproteobacteria bacterium]
MADDVDPRKVTQIAIIIAVVTVVLNAAFIFLSGAYFADRAAIHGPVSDAEISSVRIAFAAFSGLTALAACAAVFRPRIVGHALALLMSIAAFIGAAAGYNKGLHIVLPVALGLVGVMLDLLVWKSLEKSRAGWSFLAGMLGVLAVVMLFGSTKVRNITGIGLWYAMIIPGLLAVATAALAMIRKQYRDSAA